MIVRAILGFRLVTADPARLSAFYRALGFDVGEAMPISAADMRLLGLAGTGSRTALSLGPSRLELESFDQPGRPYPGGTTACDLIFQHLALVTDDVVAAWRRAREAGATPISRKCAVTLPETSGGVTAVKFRDPEGHPLELLQFPRGAQSNWNGVGIMGIDHSAISVRDLSSSKRFYAHLGLHESGTTVNQGPTQDALDGLDDVKVDVVPMSSVGVAPHLELLGYRHPVGRAIASLANNDIAATRTVWQANDEALLRDPDGHLHQLSQSGLWPANIVSRQ